MIYRLFGVLLMGSIVTSVCCQDTISAYVLDGQTDESLIGANVLLKSLKKGTSTDAKGHFRISGTLPDQVQLQISYVGYRDTLVNYVVSEDKDTRIRLEADSMEMASVVITATRTRQTLENIPQRINQIDRRTIEEYPATNTDNLLKMIPGINVNRSWGIFSRNAAISMRGMPGSSRSLILMDGVPLNKTAGGTINWHIISPDEIETIEVVKGPGSTIYGNNAMGGVINILTKNPVKKLQGFADLGYGTYNTFKAQFNLRGNNSKNSRGLFWKIGSFYRQGDGYILEPEESSDSTDVKAYLREANANGLLGYRFSSTSKIEVDYRFYKDQRGTGVKVYEEEGSYESFTDNNFRVSYEGTAGRIKLNAKAFYLNEYFFRQSENLNSSGEYKLVDTETDKEDVGLWITLSGALGRSHRLTAGIDIKGGNLDSQETYRTSTDNISTQGNLLFSALFLQDEINLGGGKFKIVAGIRLDHARFYNGMLEVNDPTGKTGFSESFTESYPESSWVQLSPKLAFNYLILPSLRTFVSISSGFMPPRLDDLVGSRKIRRGFKIANPGLIPETLRTAEWGVDWVIKSKFSVQPSLFYSRGEDFQYLVATGDFIDVESNDPIPVYQRQNVTTVEVAGAELGLEYRISEQLNVNAAYTYNYSQILEYPSSDGLDLTSMELNEVPSNLVFVGLSWRNRIVNLFLDYSYTDKQWYDEENTEIIDSYSVINMRLSRKIIPALQVSLDIQDLLDEQFIDRKGYLSPGRFIMFEVKYLFNK